MNGSIVSKYLDAKVNNISKYFEILSSFSLGIPKNLKKEYQTCIKYYISNYKFSSSDLIIKNYESFFKSNKITNDMQKHYLISMFETFINFKLSISRPDLTSLAVRVSQLFTLSTKLDDYTNSLYENNYTFNESFAKLKILDISFNSELEKILNDSKKNLKLVTQNNIKTNKKIKKELVDSNFHLIFKPLYDNKNKKNNLCIVDLEYTIDELKKYSSKDIEYIFNKKDMKEKMFLITYDLAVLNLIQLSEKGINDIKFIINMPSSFAKTSRPTKQLLKISSSINTDNLMIQITYEDYIKYKYNYGLMAENGIKFCSMYDKAMLKERKLPFKYVVLKEENITNIDNIFFIFKRFGIETICNTKKQNEKIRYYDNELPFTKLNELR